MQPPVTAGQGLCWWLVTKRVVSQVGPATCTAILCMVEESIPFMSDEALVGGACPAPEVHDAAAGTDGDSECALFDSRGWM